MIIEINSDKGRIGDFWWINSDTSKFHRTGFDFAGFRVHVDLIHWGTCGIGDNSRIRLEAADAEVLPN